MSTSVAGPEIERLVQLLARLPGLGPRSARRVALHLIRKRETLLAPLADALRVAQERILTCSVCGNVDTRDPCTICSDERRDSTTLVVVEFGRRSLGAGAGRRHAGALPRAWRRPFGARRRWPVRSQPVRRWSRASPMAA